MAKIGKQGNRYDLRKKKGPKPKAKPKAKIGRPPGAQNKSGIPLGTIKRFTDRIQTALILKRIEDHVLALEKEQTVGTGKNKYTVDDYLPPQERMRASQIKGAEVLLDRVIPRLNRTTMEGGDPDKPLHQKSEVVFTQEQLDAMADALAKRL